MSTLSEGATVQSWLLDWGRRGNRLVRPQRLRVLPLHVGSVVVGCGVLGRPREATHPTLTKLQCVRTVHKKQHLAFMSHCGSE